MSKTLALKFNCASGAERTFNFSNPKDNLTQETVTAKMAIFVANGAAFIDPLTKAVDAIVTEITRTKLFGA